MTESNSDTVIQEMDYGFFDQVEDTNYENLIGQDSKTQNNNDFFPLSYGNVEGTYKFRIYPENYNGRPRFLREVWSHKLEDGKRVIAHKDDTRVKEIIDWATEKGLTNRKDGAWKHAAMKHGILMVYMFDAPSNKYVKKEQATAFILEWRQLDALKAFFQSIEENGTNLLDFLHPGKANPGIVMTVSGQGKEQKVNCSVTGGPMNVTKLELPPMELPAKHPFTGLDHIYVDVNDTITDEQLASFKEYIEDKVEKYEEYKDAQNSDRPNLNEDENSYQVNMSQEAVNQEVK